ncbi:heparan-alpha-glucosaminide N-acetyltransferase domain-containing protein [Curtobacterium caseinilyticum]|uniref:Heparan-alpha-glucosaminide N-acetyltransferase domain-containing protein n=1 Tax=Curtobacterium caseinilyticum TaxID=3055137 RepID=A0ABT7TQZ2_9MICO|nr:heparan-alpha-glucosaminide N-acetyltransferase domain-containing protein [Curtobacterium caseinilyticum]MDM7892016.1 heparan-alpha-glucosaminide N-acetyltransferase domain-containing protein [Curtobacterium caseinilyticum]
MHHSTSSPRAHSRPRLTGLDAARGLAVLGMFAAHVGVVDTPFDWSDPTSWPDLVDGRSAVLFALCAGISLVLLTTGPGEDGRIRDRRHVLARAATLLAIGGLLTLVPGGVLVILPTYAVLFVAALPFLRLRLRWVTLAATLSLVVGPVLALVGQAVVEVTGGSSIASLLFSGYPAVSWFGIVLAGVLVARLGLDRVDVVRRTLLVGVGLGVLGYGTGIALGAALGVTGPVGTTIPVGSAGGSATEPTATMPAGGPHLVAENPPFPPIAWTRLVDVTPHAGSPFELVGALGVALAVLAILGLVARLTPTVLLPLSVVGRLALTLYCGHVLAIGVWSRSGEPDPLPALGGWGPFQVLVVAAVVLALVVQRSGRRGPLEALVRRAARALDDPPTTAR